MAQFWCIIELNSLRNQYHGFCASYDNAFLGVILFSADKLLNCLSTCLFGYLNVCATYFELTGL